MYVYMCIYIYIYTWEKTNQTTRDMSHGYMSSWNGNNSMVPSKITTQGSKKNPWFQF